jgi:ribonuclease P protein component
MFPQKKRLTKQNDINRVYKKGKRYSTPSLQLFILPTTKKYSRACVVVSNAVEKKATKRNALKRKLREILKKHLPASGFDVILKTKPKAKERTFQQLNDDIHHIFLPYQ